MIFWIEQKYKEEYMDSSNHHGIRCKFPMSLPAHTKSEINAFIKFIRRNYYFPIRLNLIFFDKPYFVNETDGHKYYGIFYDGDSLKHKYPKIFIASKITDRNPIEDVLFAISHEITHYYQWYFLEDSKRTGRSLEIEANKWSKYILHTYFCKYPPSYFPL